MLRSREQRTGEYFELEEHRAQLLHGSNLPFVLFPQVPLLFTSTRPSALPQLQSRPSPTPRTWFPLSLVICSQLWLQAIRCGKQVWKKGGCSTAHPRTRGQRGQQWSNPPLLIPAGGFVLRLPASTGQYSDTRTMLTGSSASAANSPIALQSPPRNQNAS